MIPGSRCFTIPASLACLLALCLDCIFKRLFGRKYFRFIVMSTKSSPEQSKLQMSCLCDQDFCSRKAWGFKTPSKTQFKQWKEKEPIRSHLWIFQPQKPAFLPQKSRQILEIPAQLRPGPYISSNPLYAVKEKAASWGWAKTTWSLQVVEPKGLKNRVSASKTRGTCSIAEKRCFETSRRALQLNQRDQK